MLRFKYKFIAYDNNNERITGFKYRDKKDTLLKELIKKDYKNIIIKQEVNSLSDIKLSKGNLSSGDMYEFFIELLDFVKLGNNMIESIEFIRKTSTKPNIKDLMKEILPEIKSGLKLSAALSLSNRFDQFALNILNVAEQTGNYDEALRSLAEYYKDKEEISGMIKGSMVKPIITFTALAFASIFLILSVIPKIGALFEGTEVSPPINTAILMKIAYGLENFTFLIISGIIFFIASIYTFFKSDKFIQTQLYLPIIGKIKKLNFQTQFLMSYYLLIGHGVQTNTAVQLLSDNTKDKLFKKLLIKMVKELNLGNQLSSCILENPKYFDEVVGQMIAKGEKTGTLKETSEKLYESYKTKIKRYLAKFPIILDTATLAIGGGILLFIFMGIISPVITFIENVGRGNM